MPRSAHAKRVSLFFAILDWAPETHAFHWLFDVGCWMLDVPTFLIHAFFIATDFIPAPSRRRLR
jgi:hypothetical protein